MAGASASAAASSTEQLCVDGIETSSNDLSTSRRHEAPRAPEPCRATRQTQRRSTPRLAVVSAPRCLRGGPVAAEVAGAAPLMKALAATAACVGEARGVWRWGRLGWEGAGLAPQHALWRSSCA
uniref:Uncharacterized protein n=1 Tax=Emiliania huxleyi TaxID=2903 RepID=A0A7S3VXS3_EMIHU